MSGSMRFAIFLCLSLSLSAAASPLATASGIYVLACSIPGTDRQVYYSLRAAPDSESHPSGRYQVADRANTTDASGNALIREIPLESGSVSSAQVTFDLGAERRISYLSLNLGRSGYIKIDLSTRSPRIWAETLYLNYAEGAPIDCRTFFHSGPRPIVSGGN